MDPANLTREQLIGQGAPFAVALLTATLNGADVQSVAAWVVDAADAEIAGALLLLLSVAQQVLRDVAQVQAGDDADAWLDEFLRQLGASYA